MVRKAQTLAASPAVLRWAREYCGIRTQREAAGLLDLKEDEIAALERGSIQPTATLLGKMAHIYGLSESILLLPDPPRTQPLPSDFRTVGGQAPRLSRDTIAAIRDAQRFQEFVSELIIDDPGLVTRADLSGYSESDDPEQVALEQRQSLGITLDLQRQWSVQASFSLWRLAVQDKGILVILKRMDWDEARGFSLSDEGLVPTIVVNSEESERARTFTLFHEYGHLLRRSAGICLREADSPDKRTERWCNEFAAAFLVPESDLKNYVLERYPAGPDFVWPPRAIQSLATRYRVSQAVIAIRLQRLQLAPSDFYDANKPMFYGHDRPRKRKIDPDKPLKIKRRPGWRERQKLQEIGVSGAKAVIDAWRSQVTDPEDVADVLGLSLDELFGLEDSLEVARRR